MEINKLFKMISATTLAGIMFVGCGGGSGSSSSTPTTLTGTFIDAPVKGLHYKTATQEGDTNDSGEFKYLSGETIEFKLGNLSLGSVSANGLITPYTMAGDSDISNPSNKAINIALLLQNFDADRTDGILDISKLKDIDFGGLDLTDTLKVTSEISTRLPDINLVTNFSFIDADTAKATMKNYVSQNSIKYDKKFTESYLQSLGNAYVVYRDWDNEKNVPTDYKGITLKLENGKHYETSGFVDANTVLPLYSTTYTIENGVIKHIDSEDTWYTPVLEVTDDYVLGCDLDEGETISQCQEQAKVYIFRDKSKAQVKLAELSGSIPSISVSSGFTQSYLDQVTLYQVQDGIIKTHQFRNGVWLFDDTGSALVPPTKHEGTYTIDANGALAITDVDGNFNVTISTITADYIETTTSGAITETVKFYTDKSKAQAELTGSSSTLSVATGFTTEYLNDKTFYVVSQWDSWVTYKNIFSKGTISYVGSPEDGSPEAYTVENGKIKVATGAPSAYEVNVVEVTSEYIKVSDTDSPTSYEYFYFEKAKADAKLAELTGSASSSISVSSGFTQEWVSGKTLWTVDGSKKIMTTFAFNTNNTITYGSPFNVTVPYVIMSDGIIDTTEDNGNTGHEYYKIVGIQGTKISLREGENLEKDVKPYNTADQWLFTNQADAQAFLDSL